MQLLFLDLILTKTINKQKAFGFMETYYPECDILLILINWLNKGAIYLILKETQQDILKQYGRSFYFKLPKKGTNPRGVEMTTLAIAKLIEHNLTKKLEIEWKRDSTVSYNAYDRWVEYWKET